MLWANLTECVLWLVAKWLKAFDYGPRFTVPPAVYKEKVFLYIPWVSSPWVGDQLLEQKRFGAAFHTLWLPLCLFKLLSYIMYRQCSGKENQPLFSGLYSLCTIHMLCYSGTYVGCGTGQCAHRCVVCLYDMVYVLVFYAPVIPVI